MMESDDWVANKLLNKNKVMSSSWLLLYFGEKKRKKQQV
jgi:hypothetical protein